MRLIACRVYFEGQWRDATIDFDQVGAIVNVKEKGRYIRPTGADGIKSGVMVSGVRMATDIPYLRAVRLWEKYNPVSAKKRSK